VVAKIRWNAAKAELNWQKHGVSFYAAEAIFDDEHVAWLEDIEHSHDEERFLAIGETGGGQLLVVSYTIRDDEAWLISARRATPAERRRYMRGDQIRDDKQQPIDLSDIPETDFTNAVRGRSNVVLRQGILRVSIDADVARHYTTDEAVNDALRLLIREGRAPALRDE
jgi:uncharacterized DUF497 family protein